MGISGIREIGSPGGTNGGYIGAPKLISSLDSGPNTKFGLLTIAIVIPRVNVILCVSLPEVIELITEFVLLERHVSLKTITGIIELIDKGLGTPEISIPVFLFPVVEAIVIGTGTIINWSLPNLELSLGGSWDTSNSSVANWIMNISIFICIVDFTISLSANFVNVLWNVLLIAVVAIFWGIGRSHSSSQAEEEISHS